MRGKRKYLMKKRQNRRLSTIVAIAFSIILILTGSPIFAATDDSTATVTSTEGAATETKTYSDSETSATVTASEEDSSAESSAPEIQPLTNTTTSITVTKVWNDGGIPLSGWPESVTIQLYADGVASGDAIILNASNAWTYTWTDLDKYSNGQEITYTVAETDVPDGFTCAIAGDPTVGFEVINTATANSSVTVSKVWNDNSDQDGKRPDSATVQLYADGVASGDAIILNASNAWTYIWTDLDKYSNGQEITYTVAETNVPDDYTSVVSGSVSAGFTITNTHTPETTSVSATKVWDDGSDQDGLRPDSVTVQLYADGEASGDAVELNDSNSWTHTWSDLDVYSSGEPIEYTVAETDVPDGYTSAVADNEDGTYTITNTHKPETTSVSVIKKWVGPAGTSATFKLYADGSDTGKTLTLTADDGWTGSFDNLARYKAGTAITYTVSETGISGGDATGYSTTVSGDATSGYTFTNISNAKVGVRVVKEWYGMPESVTVNLYKKAGTGDAVPVKSITLDGVGETLSTDSETGIEYGEDDAWVAVFTGLPRYDSQTGAEITYSVTEDAVSETSSVISEPTTEGDVTTFTITNTRKATFHPTVTKEWDENVNTKPVTIQLKNGNDVVDEITLDGTADGGVTETGTEKGEYEAWQGRFKAVDKFDDHGAPIEYTVSEATTGDWKSSISGTARTGFTVENAQLGSVSATLSASKTVNGGEVGGNTFSFELYEGDSTTGTLLQTVQNEHDGSVNFAPIVYTTTGTRTYTIVEKDEGVKDVTYDSSVYKVTVKVDKADENSLGTPVITYYKNDQAVSAAIFDNTVVTRTSVSFTKQWIGDAGKSATVRLMRSTNGGTAEDTGLSVTVDGTADSLTADSGTGAEYGEDAAWHGTFENLVASDRNNTYSYTLVEDAVDGYESSVIGDASEGYVFTNTELISVSGTKVWDDADNQDGLRPDSVTVNLLRNGTEVDSTTVTADNSFSFENLAKYDSDGNEYTYSVVESTVPDGYTSAVTNNGDGTFTIDNVHTPETISVSATNVWDDGNDQDGLRPDSVTVQLYANGTASGDAVELNAENNWASTWSDLAVYSGGQEITYTVEETNVPDGYTASITGDATTGFTITNTHTPETFSVSVAKVWNDNSDQDGLRPDSVTVQLYANGVASGDAIVLNAGNAWTYTWTDLDKYSNGQEITYTVAETNVPDGYTSVVTGDTTSGFTITNTLITTTGATDSTSTAEKDSPNTGNSTYIALYALLLLASAVGIICSLHLRRKNK
jgi:pilin isopeptide linkage protein